MKIKLAWKNQFFKMTQNCQIKNLILKQQSFVKSLAAL